MAARGSSYAAHGDADGLEALTKKLTADMRENLRELELVPPLSAAWNDIVDKLNRVANISEMEKKIPKSKADATLWEGEELVLRYMLEDGKLNLCVRMMEEYVDFRTTMHTAGRLLEPDDLARCSKFEFGVGQLVANALTHREACQTTEIPLLARVMASTLQLALDNPSFGGSTTAATAADGSAPPPRTLAAITLQYVAALSKHAVGSAERRIINELIKANVFDLLIRYLQAFSAKIDAGDLMQGLEGLTGLVATEEFAMQKARAVHTPEGIAAGAACREAILDPLIEDLVVRKKLRPLIDYVAELQRKARK